MKYDYIVSRLRVDQVEKALKKFGLQGWKVVSVIVDQSGGVDYWSVVLERQLEMQTLSPYKTVDALGLEIDNDAYGAGN